MSTDSRATQKTADVWSIYEPDVAKDFFGFPPLRPYLVATAFGAESAARHGANPRWAEDIVTELYLRDRDVTSVLSLCCGFGTIEQHMVRCLGSVDTCLAVDIAPGAVKEAARRAAGRDLGAVIRYDVADLNSYDWPGPTYDLVIATGALHHLARIEDVLDGVMGCLKPGGVLFANEHIGARYQDFPPRQLEMINAAAHLVPPALRRRRSLRANPFTGSFLERPVDALLGNLDLSGDQSQRSPGKRALASVLRRVTLPPSRGFGPLVRSPKQRILRSDPSEGVSSDRILHAVRRRFGDVHVHPYGGALLAYALDSAFYAGFKAEDPRHRLLLQALCSLESLLVQSGELPDEHAIIVAVKGEAETASC